MKTKWNSKIELIGNALKIMERIEKTIMLGK